MTYCAALILDYIYTKGSFGALGIVQYSALLSVLSVYTLLAYTDLKNCEHSL